jgi:hypothetical protein
MLTMRQHNAHVPPYPFPSLAALLAASFPHPPQEMLPLAQRLSIAAAPTAEQMWLAPLTRAHEDEHVVRQAMAQARIQGLVPGVPKGLRTTSVWLLGGTRLVRETPSLCAARQSRRGRRRRKRGSSGPGGSPVLAALGIADRVSPASRMEIALHVVQAASDLAAAELRSRRGLPWAVSSLVRSTTATAEASTRLRAAALEATLRRPVSPAGPLAGQRGRVGLAGGRVRPRRKHRGRKTAKGRHGVAAPWRAPRVLVIDMRDEHGQPARLRWPLYEVRMGEAEAIWALLLGSGRLLGAAYAAGVECSAAGAEWRWQRGGRLRTLAEMPAAQGVEGLDCSHASPERYETLATCRNLPKAQRHALDKRVRHAWRHQTEGVEGVPEALRAWATPPRSTAITRAWRSVETQAHRMRYETLEARQRPIGAGQVESAMRRVVHLRCKAPGAFWRETTVSGLRPLRAACKAGRWDEVLRGVLPGTSQTPSFEPVGSAATQQSAAAQARETAHMFVKPRKKAASGAHFLPMHPGQR